MKTDNILNPVVTVTLRGETYEVRELPWKDYLRLVKEMTSTAFELFGGAKIGVAELSLDKDKLIHAISQQEELIGWLFGKATNVKAEVISDLTATEAITLLDLVIQMNLRPELLAAGKGLAGRMGEVFQLKNPSLAPQTVSSSPATS